MLKSFLQTLLLCSLLSLAVVAAGMSAPSRTDYHPNISVASCGDVAGRLLYSIRTQRVTCIAARRIATQWATQCAQLRTGSCLLVTALFYCRYRDTGLESGAIRCIHDLDLRKPFPVQRTVTFVTGS